MLPKKATNWGATEMCNLVVLCVLYATVLRVFPALYASYPPPVPIDDAVHSYFFCPKASIWRKYPSCSALSGMAVAVFPRWQHDVFACLCCGLAAMLLKLAHWGCCHFNPAVHQLCGSTVAKSTAYCLLFIIIIAITDTMATSWTLCPEGERIQECFLWHASGGWAHLR